VSRLILWGGISLSGCTALERQLRVDQCASRVLAIARCAAYALSDLTGFSLQTRMSASPQALV
jgi:hypothetical protein